MNDMVVPDINDQLQFTVNDFVEIMIIDPIKDEAGIATALLIITLTTFVSINVFNCPGLFN